MGKRKLHGNTYYQCDWTGFPMKSANCFMPSWTLDDKLIKKGSYCNWESVLAHARHIYNVEKQLEDVDLERINDFVKVQMGDAVHNTEAPHFTDLEHFKQDGTRNLSAEEYHKACCYQTDEVVAVKINEAGNTFEVLVDSIDGSYDFARFLKTPANWDLTPSCFQSFRKGKNKEKELCIYYHPSAGRMNGNGLLFNSLASNLFKMQIYGEVLLVQSTKEASFMPRERYVNYTLVDFTDNFMRKRKRVVQDTNSLDTEEYKKLKAEMQESLCAYEKQAASSAQVPGALAKAGKCPPSNGRDLARLKKHEASLLVAAA